MEAVKPKTKIVSIILKIIKKSIKIIKEEFCDEKINLGNSGDSGNSSNDSDKRVDKERS